MYQAAASFTGDSGEAAFLVSSVAAGEARRFPGFGTRSDSIRLLAWGGCVGDRHQLPFNNTQP
jgi:hypothetical protein